MGPRAGQGRHASVYVQPGRHGRSALLRRQQPQHRHDRHRHERCDHRIRAAEGNAGWPHPDGRAPLHLSGHQHRFRRRPRDHRWRAVRREYAAAARQSGPRRTGSDARDTQQRGRCTGALPRRPIQFRVPAVGRNRPHPGQLVTVPAAGYDADARADRALHGCTQCGSEFHRRAGALLRVDVRSDAEHAAADHAAPRGHDGHGRRRGAAEEAPEHHPGSASGPGRRPDDRRARHQERLRFRRRRHRSPQHRHGRRPLQDHRGAAPGALHPAREGRLHS